MYRCVENIKMNLTKKDLIRINQEIGEGGQLQNESSLEFALGMMKLRKGWLYELAYLLRSLVIDHNFKDGNKRTALAAAILYFEEEKVNWDRERMVKTIYEIAKKNYKSIDKIMRVIKDGLVN